MLEERLAGLEQWCLYYQAHIPREKVWFFVAALRSQEHVCFDRTVNVQESVFEFFVPVSQEEMFVKVMASLEHEGLVQGLVKLENRVMASGSF